MLFQNPMSEPKLILKDWTALLPAETPASSAVGEDEVHCWLMDLSDSGFPGPPLEGIKKSLSADELARAKSMTFPEVHARFVRSRWCLRDILGRYLGQRPSEVFFRVTPEGKPYLDPAVHSARLCFNLSHSDCQLILGVSSGYSIGVDIEKIRPISRLFDVMARVFTPQEVGAVGALPSLQQVPAFFRLWTCKEAVVKALGTGIFQDAREVSLGLHDDLSVELLSLPQTAGNPAHWRLIPVSVAPGFISMIAVDLHASTDTTMGGN